MRAVEVRAFGPPGVLRFAGQPDPVPGPGPILVSAAAAGVLFVDTLTRSGAGRACFPVRPPCVPGLLSRRRPEPPLRASVPRSRQ